MCQLTRGSWVRHQPTGGRGRLEIIGGKLVCVLPYPPDNAGWLTGLAADFVPLVQAGIDDIPLRVEPPRCPAR